MVSIDNFICLASTSDPMVDQSPIRVKRQSLINLEERNTTARDNNAMLFLNRDEISISRQDIFSINAKDNIDQFIVSVLYWGFPTNMHGICRKVFESYSVIRDLTLKILNQPNVTLEYYQEDIYPIIARCYGVKMAFFSKLFYFCRMSINGIPCLILDSFVYKGLGCVDDAQIKQIQVEADGYNYKFMPYYSYIQGINALSERAQVRGEQIEYILFTISR